MEEITIPDIPFGVDKVAELLGVDARYVRRLVQEDRIGYYRYGPAGSLIRFTNKNVAEFLDGHSVQPASTASSTSHGDHANGK